MARDFEHWHDGSEVVCTTYGCKLPYTLQRNSMGRTRYPLSIVRDNNPDIEWLSVPRKDLKKLIEEYNDTLEGSLTREWCLCEWIIHPDDVDLPEGKRRLRRGDEDPECALHTKAGYLLGFFKFVFKDSESDDSND